MNFSSFDKQSFVIDSLVCYKPHPTMNSFFVCLLLGVTLQTAISQITPAITYISSKQVGEIGGSAELQCSASNAQEVPLLWIKSAHYPVIISSGNALLVRDNRYSIRHDVTSWTFTLKINDLQLADAGLFQCVLSIGPGNLLTNDVELQVRQPIV